MEFQPAQRASHSPAPRGVRFPNTASSPLMLEVLDGLPALIPFGLTNGALKEIGRTIEAWMEVVHHRERLPFYRLKATSDDSLRGQTVESGNFALGFLEGGLLPA